MNSRSVSAGGSVDRSVVVTGDGNSVSLSFGGSFTLPLDRRQLAPNRVTLRASTPLSLLAPDAGLLPLVGREAMLGELRTWAQAGNDVSVHALIARAGTGKTRLALELCKSLDGDFVPGAGGWVAGFIRPGDLATVIGALATRSFDWAQPTLLVIDYAAAVHRELAKWLDRLAAQPFSGKLRLLLLDREAPEGFGWFHDLTQPPDNRSTTRRDLFVDPNRPQSLPDLQQGDERRALLQAALSVAESKLDSASLRHALPGPGDDPDFESALASPRFGNPLNLAMAGLIAAERGPTAALALRRLDAARYLARHEIGRMVRISEGEGVSPLAMRHALGFNGLAGGLALATLREDLAHELSKGGLDAPAAALADILMQELPRTDDQATAISMPRLNTIQPDLIGEGVIVETLLLGPPDRALRAGSVVQRAHNLTGARAAEAVMRLIQDFGHAIEDPAADSEEREVARSVFGLLTAVTDAIPDNEIERLETLVSAFPKSTTVLREAAAAQTKRLADIWRHIDDSLEPNDDLKATAARRAAGWLNNLANRLGDLGQREEALATAQQAADRYRQLIASQPDLLPALATALANVSGRLSDLNQRDAAYQSAVEAVDLYRALARERPSQFTDHLASALSNLGNRLGDLGRREEALQAISEAVDLRRSTEAFDHEEAAADLAVYLNNLAGHLVALDRGDEALATIREAVGIYRRLGSAGPDAFMPDLAMSLSNLAVALARAGQKEPARSAAEEAVSYYRILASARPEAFMPNLATSLSVLASCLAALGEREAALTADQESVDLFRALASARPDVFTAQLAGLLNNLASTLGTFDQHEAALAAAHEAVELFQGLADAHPEAFMPDLARSLSVLGDRLEVSGRLKEAVAADRRSIAALSPFVIAEPRAFARPMVAYLRDYFRRADQAGLDVDDELIGPITNALKGVFAQLGS
jgi:tetratricopeptide (TPR) repeat protein